MKPDLAAKPDRQREHQANERTFLAWLRTAVSLMSFGFVIARFGLFLQELSLSLVKKKLPSRELLNSRSVGVALTVLGIAVTLGAAWRYEQVYNQIEQGNFKPTRRWVWILAAVIAILGLLTIPFLLTQLPA